MPQTTRRPSRRAFSLVELLAVLAVLVIVVALAAVSLGSRPAGARQGAIASLMQTLEEARMRAIETGAPVHVALAGPGHSDPGKRLCACLVFRDQTAEEQPDPAQRRPVPLTRWESLPQGFYFDPAGLSSVAPERPVDGLPGGEEGQFHVLTFNSLGQLDWSSESGRLSVVEGALDDTFRVKNESFRLEIARLTGRVRLLRETSQ